MSKLMIEKTKYFAFMIKFQEFKLMIINK